jgi:hypothetical protein
MRPRLFRSASNTEIKVEVEIRAGSASPAQKAAWAKFWRKVFEWKAGKRPEIEEEL